MEIPGNGENFKQSLINTYFSECNEYKIKYFELQKKLKDIGIICNSCNELLSQWEINYSGFYICFKCKIKKYVPMLVKFLSIIKYFFF